MSATITDAVTEATHIKVGIVCNWPNLTLLPDGTIISIGFNQPCHGRWEGGLDCWASNDGGLTWGFHGHVAINEPGTNRMNAAIGVATNGDLLALVAGYRNRKPRPSPMIAPEDLRSYGPFVAADRLRSWVCRSQDGGKTWKVVSEFAAASGAGGEYSAYGDMQRAVDGALCVAAYVVSTDLSVEQAFLFRSYDDGMTWSEPYPIDDPANETAVIHLSRGKWLAAARVENEGLTLLTSSDDGRSWTRRSETFSEPHQVPAHFLRLRDGRVLLTHGDRRPEHLGIVARLSDDEGETWSEPFRIGEMKFSDSGYPDSVQREDGRIVTAYYHKNGFVDYSLKIAIWQPPEN